MNVAVHTSIILNSPFIVFIISLVSQWLAAYVGYFLRWAETTRTQR